MTSARPKVLIGFAGALAAPEVAWSLLDAGFEVHGIRRRGVKPPLNASRAVQLHDITSPSEDVDAAVTELEALIESVAPDVVMPLDDAAVWLCDRAALPETVKLAGPTGDRVALALDKRRQMGAALMAGFDVPPSRVFETPELPLSPDPAFPVMVKPSLAIERHDGRLTTGAKRACADQAELRSVLRSFPAGMSFFLQPYVAGVGEGLFGVARHGEVKCWSAHRRVRMMSPAGSGSSACAPAPLDPALLEAASAFIEAAEWDGLFMIELLRDEDGRPWFVELNGRAWGSMALARRMGFEYPAWAVSSVLDERFEPPAPAPREPVVCRHLGRELVHLLIVLRGRHSAAIRTWPTRHRTARDILRIGRSDRWYNLRRGELPLFVYDSVRTVFREVRKALGL